MWSHNENDDLSESKKCNVISFQHRFRTHKTYFLAHNLKFR